MHNISRGPICPSLIIYKHRLIYLKLQPLKDQGRLSLVQQWNTIEATYMRQTCRSYGTNR